MEWYILIMMPHLERNTVIQESAYQTWVICCPVFPGCVEDCVVRWNEQGGIQLRVLKVSCMSRARYDELQYSHLRTVALCKLCEAYQPGQPTQWTV